MRKDENYQADQTHAHNFQAIRLRNQRHQGQTLSKEQGIDLLEQGIALRDGKSSQHWCNVQPQEKTCT
jgi:hypothetical protein